MMLKRWMLSLLLLSGLFLPRQPEALELAVMHGNKQQRDNFVSVLRSFYDETGIRVTLLALTDKEYKQQFPLWLSTNTSPDILYWQGGERLLAYAREGALRPLDDLWQEQRWKESFGQAMQEAVSLNGHTYALPFSYYHWGIFYSQSVLAQAGVTPPDTWQALLQACTRLRAQGITPIVVGGKDKWPVLAWFDYINLRLNGLAFHQALTRGLISYHDPRVRAVLQHWQQLIQARCFNDNLAQLNWDDSIPYLYFRKAAMTLMGSFAPTPRNNDDIKAQPFPTIRPEIPRYEDAPLDLFVLPARANPRMQEVKTLLSYLGRVDIQNRLNRGLGTFSPHMEAWESLNPTQQASKRLLEGAAGFAQYFDRDVSPEFDRAATPLMAQFAINPEIATTQAKLEALRQQLYPQAAQGEGSSANPGGASR